MSCADIDCKKLNLIQIQADPLARRCCQGNRAITPAKPKSKPTKPTKPIDTYTPQPDRSALEQRPGTCGGLFNQLLGGLGIADQKTNECVDQINREHAKAAKRMGVASPFSENITTVKDKLSGNGDGGDDGGSSGDNCFGLPINCGIAVTLGLAFVILIMVMR